MGKMKKARTAQILVSALLTGLLSACAGGSMWQSLISDVYIEGFQPDDIQSCRSPYVPLGHARARDFFRRARQVDYKVIHDHYDVAPCYTEGTLKYFNNTCKWEIRAGVTGDIKCEGNTQYFVCDDCGDLFREP